MTANSTHRWRKQSISREIAKCWAPFLATVYMYIGLCELSAMLSAHVANKLLMNIANDVIMTSRSACFYIKVLCAVVAW